MGSPVVVEGSVPEGASAGASAGLGDVSRSLTEHFDGDERGVAARAIQELKEALCAVCEWRSRAEAAELEVAALREKCGRYRCRARDAEAAEGRFAERGVTSFLETLADELAIGAIRLARAELGTSEEDRLSSPSDAGASPVAFARASTPTLATPFGAGVGLTSLKLAGSLPGCYVATDLEAALPLLEANIAANASSHASSSVSAAPLCWGDADHHASLRASLPPPAVVLAADCVYWEALHAPLRATLAFLLGEYPSAVVLIAGARRWKRDTAFYASLGGKSPSLGNAAAWAAHWVQHSLTRSRGSLSLSLSSRRRVFEDS